MNCPNCNSTNTTTFQMACVGGTSTGAVSGITHQTQSGFGSFSGKTSQQTALARMTAPPANPSFGWLWITGAWFGMGFFGLLLAAFIKKVAGIDVLFLINLLLFTSIILLIVLRSKYFQQAKERYQQQLDQWRRSWICLRCGSKWVS